jgi:hypothetical protein
MSYLCRELGLRPPHEASCDALHQFMEEFAALRIPYETLSNHSSGVLIKPPVQLSAAYRDGLGGHCLEQAQLLRAVLVEAGFHARLVHADQLDLVSQSHMRCSQTYVLVTLEAETYLCDAFLTRRAYPLPVGEGVRWGPCVIRRPLHDMHRWQMELLWFDEPSDELVREERLYLYLPEDTREKMFHERYANFSPFGVLTPFFRLARPDTSIHYVPAFDEFSISSKGQVRRIRRDELAEETWIPAPYRQAIQRAADELKGRRQAYLQVLKRDLSSPYVEPLRA